MKSIPQSLKGSGIRLQPLKILNNNLIQITHKIHMTIAEGVTSFIGYFALAIN
jgi:hypothetical protein